MNLQGLLFHCDRPEHGYDCFCLDEKEEPAYVEYLRSIIEEGTIVTPVLDRDGTLGL